MSYLITGGCGFMGSNISKHLISKGEKVYVLDNLSREGSIYNLNKLKNIGEFKFYNKDVRNSNDIEVLIKSIKPKYIFHLAGQVAMTKSIEDPLNDFQTNTIGTINLLESIRKYSKETTIIYSSTNKVYGDLNNLNYTETNLRYKCIDYPNGFDSEMNLEFSSPYGCSKGSADQYLIDYHRIYGIKTIVFRHSSMYGGLQHPSYDQGWVSWFVLNAVKTIKNKNHTFTISGNGKQVRDLLHADDVVDLYLTVKDNPNCYGKVFNIGGGEENSMSLLELFEFLQKELNVKLNYKILEARKSDQKVFISNNDKIKKVSSWEPKITKENGLKESISWINSIH